jgi:hypothetical protein
LLKKLNEFKKEIKLLHHEINLIQSEIENESAEIDVLENYGRFVENLHGSGAKKLEMMKNLRKRSSNDNDAYLSAALILQNEIVQRENDLKNLKDIKEEKKIEKENLKMKLQDIDDNIKSHKEELENIKNKLLLHYHLLLSEGLDTRGEGLVWIIKSIWNLGENVNISYMPNYLDEKCIDFLFSIAHKDYELNKMNEDLEFTKQNLRNSISKISMKNNNNNSNQKKENTPINYIPPEIQLEFVNDNLIYLNKNKFFIIEFNLI